MSSPVDRRILELGRESGAEDTDFRNNLEKKKCVYLDPAVLLVGIPPKDIIRDVCEDIATKMLFITVKEWKLFINSHDSEKCPTVGDWLNKLCYIHAMEFHSDNKTDCR